MEKVILSVFILYGCQVALSVSNVEGPSSNTNIVSDDTARQLSDPWSSSTTQEPSTDSTVNDIVATKQQTTSNFTYFSEDFSSVATQHLEFFENFEAPYEIRKSYPYYMSGYDFENNPIWIIELGKWNFRKSVAAGGEAYKNFENYCLQAAYRVLHSVPQEDLDSDEPNSGVMLILDFDGLNLNQVTHIPTLSFVISFIRTYLSVIDKYIVYAVGVNTNTLAYSVVNIMRPFLGRVFERVEVYGTNKSKYLPHLLKRAPKKSLPEWYGGSKNFKPVKIYG